MFRRKITIKILSFLFLLILMSCQKVSYLPGGSLTLSVSSGGDSARLIAPALEMEISTYEITGSGPSGDTFSRTLSPGASLTIDNLSEGSWSISVLGKNNDGTIIAAGSAGTSISAGQSSSLTLSVYALQGEGTLDLSVSWNPDLVDDPVIDAQLVPQNGSDISLAFTVDSSNGTASLQQSVASGFYTLKASLYDGEIKVKGMLDVLYVVEGQTSSGTLNFFTTVPHKNSGLEGQLQESGGQYSINGTVILGDNLENGNLEDFVGMDVYIQVDRIDGVYYAIKIYGITDYRTALEYGVVFYDANKSGPNAAVNNVFSWRGASHTSDGSDIGLDLTGGYNDAGDHIKFGLPAAYAASVMGWTYYEYQDSFAAAGNAVKMEQQLRYFGDYLLKLHPTPSTFIWQITEGANDFGTGGNSHNHMQGPESDTLPRATFVFDLNGEDTHPRNSTSDPYLTHADAAVSDVAGQSAAALAIMYLNFRDRDPAYAQNCLDTAESMYDLATAKLGLYPLNATYGVDKYYGSSSYEDDLSWAAVWLYIATDEQAYLTDAESFIAGTGFETNNWTMDWANSHLGAALKLAEVTGKQVYKDALEYNIEWWITGDLSASGGQAGPTAGGLRYLNDWASLRYVSSACNLAQQYYRINPDPRYLEFAKSQMDYILGDNPNDMSYLIGFTGFGSRFPSCPHHRGANPGLQGAAEHELTGAMVGGPNSSDQFSDDPGAYEYTEVALDYNASFVSAMAGMVSHFTDLQ